MPCAGSVACAARRSAGGFASVGDDYVAIRSEFPELAGRQQRYSLATGDLLASTPEPSSYILGG